MNRFKPIAIFAALGLSACGQQVDSGKPERANDAIKAAPQTSLLLVPVEAELADLKALLEREVPKQLWTINKPDQTCVASKGLDLGIATIKTPRIKCRIVGEVTRGAMRIGGAGREIRLVMPIQAVIRVEDIGGILKRETATANAMANAVIRLDVAQDWTPRGKIDITYDWTNEPHIDFLGQRIDLTKEASQKLAPVIAKLERELPGELDKLRLKQGIEQAWASSFTTLSLNRKNPPVWMRVSPRELQYGGYEVVGGKLRLRLGMQAITDTFVGTRPANPPPTPLPPMRPLAGKAGNVEFFVPVYADYRELEPVVLKALRKRSGAPFEVPGVGAVNARFDNAEVFGATGGRIAVGIAFAATDATGGTTTQGTVWMTGKPVNAHNSRKVGFEDFGVSGTTDMTGGSLILKLANAPGVADMIAGALLQDFEHDYAKLLSKIDRAVDAKRAGDFVIHANFERTRSGQLQAAGSGLYLPVWASGTASVEIVQ